MNFEVGYSAQVLRASRPQFADRYEEWLGYTGIIRKISIHVGSEVEVLVGIDFMHVEDLQFFWIEDLAVGVGELVDVKKVLEEK